MSVEINRSKCIYCGACVAVCPASALKLKETFVECDCNKCVKCGTCEKACPAGAITVKKD